MIHEVVCHPRPSGATAARTGITAGHSAHPRGRGLPRGVRPEPPFLVRHVPHQFNALDPSWLTSTVVALANGIYADRAFDRMPILADALMDAGCDNDDVLDHCRGVGPYVRGCWVVDLLTGRK